MCRGEAAPFDSAFDYLEPLMLTVYNIPNNAIDRRLLCLAGMANCNRDYSPYGFDSEYAVGRDAGIMKAAHWTARSSEAQWVCMATGAGAFQKQAQMLL